MRKKHFFKVFGKIGIAFLFMFSLLLATNASADFVAYKLDTGSTLPDTDYGYISLKLNETTKNIDVVVDLSASGAKIVNTGFAYSVALNMVDTDVQIGVTGLDSDYKLVNSGIKPTDLSKDGKMDGFGLFEYGVLFNTSGGGAGTDSKLTFAITRAGGFTSVYNLVESSTNPPGNLQSPFAVDVFYEGATGVIGTSGSTVPLPAAAWLLGSGLVGLVAIRRRQTK